MKCVCEERGVMRSGIRGILAGPPNKYGCRIMEKCDACDRFPSDESAGLWYARGSTQAIFCNTIEYVLAKGPLRTTEMHPLIQRLHPDICDDRIDRVIDGVNFGKKWKHHVRTAQQALKRAHKIEFDGEKWYLTGRP